MFSSACVFSIDDAYVLPFQVFFHSLEATGSIPSSTSLFILHTVSLSTASIEKLQAYLGCYGRSASFVDAAALIPSELPIRPGDHVSPATFYRLFIAEILPAEIERVVYLDSDMLALRSIAPLFHEPMQGLVAAVDHCSPEDEIRLWGARGGTYFQAGVLVIPVQIWREQGILQQFLNVMANEQERIKWWDQDVLNITLRDRWQRLPVWLNVCAAVHRALPSELLDPNVALIHYTGSDKPWNTFNPSPYTAHWDKGYQAAFQQAFNRQALRSFSLPLTSLIKSAVRRRLAGFLRL